MITESIKSKKRIISAVAAALLTVFSGSLLCGCADISHREFIFPNAEDPFATDDSLDGVGGDLLIVTGESGADGTDAAGGEDDVPDSLVSFSPERQAFISSCFFMGDSICLGLGVSGFTSRCSAKAGVAARNIEDFLFDYEGAEVSPFTALVNSDSDKFVFLMGSNDVNMVTEEDYAKNYNSFLSKVEALCPEADIYVLSIPPVTENSTFCYNYEIDSFNARLKEMIEEHHSAKRHYVDISAYLKDDRGNLKEEYSSDNTVHLTKSAYLALLAGLCKEVGV